MKRTFRTALALAAAATAVIVPTTATPAQAGFCSAGRADAKWGNSMSIQLMRDGACRYYNRLTIDNAHTGAGHTISWMVQRLELNSQGYFVTEEKQRSDYWFVGQRDTEKVNGNDASSSSAPDWHRVCYTIDFQQPWTCTDWAGY